MDNNFNILSLAAYSLDENERFQSSSGGVFSLFAKSVLSQNGVVYGVAMCADCKNARFIRVDKEKQLAKLRGSKYLQAIVGEAYNDVKKDLINGKKVLFSGTGCQVNGLIKFLGKDNVQKRYTNLYCIDIVCHGVPSPKLWKKYVDFVENKYNKKLLSINFRSKMKNWKGLGIKQVDSINEEVFISKNDNPYMIMFLRDYSLRPSCYSCKAKEIKYADVTIADFWGIDEVAPDMNDNKGTSLIIARTQKGIELLNSIKEKIKTKDVEYEKSIEYNSAEYSSVNKPKERDSFFVDMKNENFEKLIEKYCQPKKISLKQRLKACLKQGFIKLRIIREEVEKTTYGMLLIFKKGND